MFPSGPAAMPTGLDMLAELYSVTVPSGAILATSFVPESRVTHMFPSGPGAIWLLAPTPLTVNSPATTGSATAGADSAGRATAVTARAESIRSAMGVSQLPP